MSEYVIKLFLLIKSHLILFAATLESINWTHLLYFNILQHFFMATYLPKWHWPLTILINNRKDCQKRLTFDTPTPKKKYFCDLVFGRVSSILNKIKKFRDDRHEVWLRKMYKSHLGKVSVWKPVTLCLIPQEKS